MEPKIRKNLHVPADLAKAIGDIHHDARFESETRAIVTLLEGAIDALRNAPGYVYLADGGDRLKIGYSRRPVRRTRAQKLDLLYCLRGGRLMESAAHLLWGRFKIAGEFFEPAAEIVSWFESHEMRISQDDVIAAGRVAEPRFVTVTMQRSLVREIDALANDDGRRLGANFSRSAMIGILLRESLDARREAGK